MHNMPVDDRHQLYARPPIVEAVFELRFASPVSENRSQRACDRLAKEYTKSSVKKLADVKVDFNTQQATFVNTHTNFQLSSSDLADIYAVSANSMLWARRAPYEGWEKFSSKFGAELPQVMKVLGDPQIARIGLRYVNRIDVRLDNELAHYEDFLKFRIQHDDILDPATSFQWTLVKEFTDTGLKVLVQSASVEPEIPGYAAFSFDIDVFCDSNPPSKAIDILLRVKEMRVLKNKIFEAGITDKAREYYS